MKWRPAWVHPARVLIANPLIGVTIMSDRKRTGVLASLTGAPISELSIVFAATGIPRGHIWGPGPRADLARRTDPLATHSGSFR